jgi:hypothetical protein
VSVCLCIVYALRGRRVKSLFDEVCLDEGFGEGGGAGGLGVEDLVR